MSSSWAIPHKWNDLSSSSAFILSQTAGQPISVQEIEPCVRAHRHAAAADRAVVLCCWGNCHINNSTDVSTQSVNCRHSSSCRFACRFACCAHTSIAGLPWWNCMHCYGNDCRVIDRTQMHWCTVSEFWKINIYHMTNINAAFSEQLRLSGKNPFLNTHQNYTWHRK